MSTDGKGERLRVAYIVGAFPDLSETFIVNQIAGVAARGHVVDIYTTWTGNRGRLPAAVERLGLMQRVHELAPPRRVIRTLALLATVGWRAPLVLWRLLLEVRRSGLAGSLRLLHGALALVRLGAPRYDAIHAQFGPFGLLASQLLKVGALRGPLITSFRGFDVGKDLPAGSAAYADLFRRGALFLPVSQALAARLIEAGCDRSRVRVHRSGIFCQELRYRDPGRGISGVQLITVARLVEKKGIEYAIRAVKRVAASGRPVSYVVVGDGPLRGELQRLIWQLGVEAQVRLVGAKSHGMALAMIRTADVLIAPSVTAADGDQEGIPNAMKEAMAMGLPVIGTRHGGIPELVEDGVSGFLVPERDVDALSDRLMYLLHHPDIWPALGKAGRRQIESQYDIERLNDELIAMYRELSGRQARITQTTGMHKPGISPSWLGIRRS